MTTKALLASRQALVVVDRAIFKYIGGERQNTGHRCSTASNFHLDHEYGYTGLFICCMAVLIISMNVTMKLGILLATNRDSASATLTNCSCLK